VWVCELDRRDATKGESGGRTRELVVRILLFFCVSGQTASVEISIRLFRYPPGGFDRGFTGAGFMFSKGKWKLETEACHDHREAASRSMAY